MKDNLNTKNGRRAKKNKKNLEDDLKKNTYLAVT